MFILHIIDQSNLEIHIFADESIAIFELIVDRLPNIRSFEMRDMRNTQIGYHFSSITHDSFMFACDVLRLIVRQSVWPHLHQLLIEPSGFIFDDISDLFSSEKRLTTLDITRLTCRLQLI